MTSTKLLLPLALLAALATAAPIAVAVAAGGEHEHGAASAASAAGKVGEVRFPVSCSPAAQAQFERAVAILHSFWYEEAAKAFPAVAETDPSCAMAYWGVAMSGWYPLWYPPGEAALKKGLAAVERAKAIGAKTDRERDYIAAIEAFYRDSDRLDHRTRAVAYEKAMEQLHLRYPDDREAAVFYALALNATALPTDKSYANELKAATILEKVWAEAPDHPGVAHYLIHSYDYPPLAEKGLPASRRYAKIAPAAPHALHMPAHIFTRLGLWQESIDSNSDSAAAGRDYAAKMMGGDGVVWDQTLHALDYLAYAYLQGAQDRQTERVLGELTVYRKAEPASRAAAYALAAIPARYALERRDWSAAAALTPPPMAFAWERFPWAQAMISFTRAVGAARTGDTAAAKAEIDRLQSQRDALVQAKDVYWANQVEVQRKAAAAVLARAEGRNEEALALLHEAADLDASMEKSPVTPAAVLPARELLADVLLELDRPALALAEYERTLAAEPNRFRSLYGAARAAELAGDPAKAKPYYERLLTVCERADTQRPELAQAQAYLSK